MASSFQELSLPEQILLLALRDEKGTIAFTANLFAYALGGAILTELALSERIRISEDRTKLVGLLNATPLGDPVVDDCLQAIATSKRRRSAGTWVSRFAHVRKLKHRIAEGLCRKGVLRNAEDQILLVFKRKVYPTIDPEPERALVERLREAIFGDGASIDPRVAAATALAHAAQMLPVAFPRKELRRRKARLDAIVRGDRIGGATRDAVREAQAAVTAAVMASVIAASSASSAGH